MKNDRNNLKKLTVETLITLGFVAVSLLSLKYLGQPLAGIITGVLILLLALREYQNYKKLQTKPEDKSAEESEPDTQYRNGRCRIYAAGVPIRPHIPCHSGDRTIRAEI
jgi:L-lactate permease